MSQVCYCLREGRFTAGNGARNEQHVASGAQSVAAAAGTVIAVRDGMAEGTPFRLPTTLENPRDYAGNRVVVQQSPDVFATYAHLQPGSITAQVGDQVATGRPGDVSATAGTRWPRTCTSSPRTARTSPPPPVCPS